MILNIPNESAMTALGQQLAQVLKAPALIYLHGDLGAGKTTLTRAIIHALGFQGRVKSPTYTIVESYQFDQQAAVPANSRDGGLLGGRSAGPLRFALLPPDRQILYHFDFYRISDAAELEFIGLEEYFTQQAICLIEWPEHALPLLPPADLLVHIDILEVGRQVSIIAQGQHGQAMLEHFLNVCH